MNHSNDLLGTGFLRLSHRQLQRKYKQINNSKNKEKQKWKSE
jgi:hypothetical protein